MPETGGKNGTQHSLEISLDVSQISGEAEAQELRVAARAQDGSLTAKTVRAEPGRHVVVELRFAEHPGPLQVLVGPATASESDLVNLQTISVNVSGRQWEEGTKLSISPIVITPYYWWWWLEWCRTFVIRGKVVCADGSPVPGATVCAYDVDWWFWWTSTEQIGCATTGADGTFKMEFTWCCGWLPWWWWRERVWEINPDLISKVSATLEQDPRIRLGRASAQPSLAVFSDLLGPATPIRGQLVPADTERLEKLRKTLVTKFPSSSELTALRVWPWWPWWPWWDCNPDVIFKVTQDCTAPGTVLLQEGVDHVRFNVGVDTTVTLTANELACCRRQCPTQPCTEGECLDISDICTVPIDEVGGNAGTSGPVGYAYPGAGDRAFGGQVDIYEANIVTGIDYYEVQYLSASGWASLPPGAAMNFSRKWEQPPLAPGDPWSSAWVPFPFVNRVVAGSSASVSVVETREHYETTTGFGLPKFWTVYEWLVIPIDSSKFTDGTYEFRVVGWRDAGGGQVSGPAVIPGGTYTLQGGEVLPVCGNPTLTNSVVLAFNNRLEPDPGAILPCGAGSTHVCVTEPNTNIISVKVDGKTVAECGTVDTAGAVLEVEFLAEDLSGNLASYSLTAVYGSSHAVDLLALRSQPGGSLTLVSGDAVGPTYAEALAEGVPAPVWRGGRMKLTVDAAKAFPVPCCYDLELTALSRTIVSCHVDDYVYWNRSDFTVGVGVCPPPRRLQVAELPAVGATS